MRVTQRISDFWWECRAGIKNLIRWLPIIWNDRDWDQVYLQRLIERKLRFTSTATKDWHVIRAHKSGQEMLICAELLKRMTLDEYTERCLPLGQDRDLLLDPKFKNRWMFWKHANAIAKADMELFTKILRRKMNTWWD